MNWTEPELEKYILKEFYWFHSHPELSWEEIETTQRLRAALTAADIRILDVPLHTGLIAEIGTGHAPIAALRCDIDALPIQEETELSYRSVKDGRMHACGHDFHTAAVLGTALLLKQQEDSLAGTVRILFQPAEEAASGAREVLSTDALKDTSVIFGIHSSPLFPVGTVALREGAVTAAVDRFSFTIRGKGTHAAHPQNGIDPTVAAAAFVSAAQSVVSRNVDPFAANLVSITHLESGSTWNVIPETAFIEGTTRTLKKEDRQLVRQRLNELAEYTARAYGCTLEAEWDPGLPATANDRFWTDFSVQEAQSSGLSTETAPASLGGEDFALYQEQFPGTFVLIGTGLSASNHNPHFQVDPAALLPTAHYLARLTEHALAHVRKAAGEKRP